MQPKHKKQNMAYARQWKVSNLAYARQTTNLNLTKQMLIESFRVFVYFPVFQSRTRSKVVRDVF